MHTALIRVIFIFGVLCAAGAPASQAASVLKKIKYSVLSQPLLLEPLVTTYLQAFCRHFLVVGARHRKVLQQQQRECRKGAQDLWQVLQLGSVVVHSATEATRLPVAFQPDLTETLQNPFFPLALEDLQWQLLHGPRPLSLWLWAEDYFGNPRQALQFIALFLQDISAAETVSAYLQQQEFNEPALLVSRLNQNLRNELQQQKLGLIPANRLQVFPVPSTVMKRNAFYHFYVSAELSLRLKTLGHSDRMAAGLSLAFNALYEQLSLNPKYFFQLPTKLASKDSVADIYLGYCGGVWALGYDCRAFDSFYQQARSDFPVLLEQILRPLPTR